MGVYIHKRCDVMANPKRSAIPESVKKKRALSVRKHAAGPDRRKIKVSLKDLPKARGNVGARNPRVLAIRQLLILHPDYPIQSLQDRPLKYLMMEAFKIKSDAAYQAMFDPKSGSPLYQGLLHATRKLARSRPRLHRGFLPILELDPGGKTGANPPYCAGRVLTGSLSTKIHNKTFEFMNQTDTRNNGLEFNDPQQGCLANCWLIAALSSVAWAETNGYPRKLARTPAALQIPPSDKWPTKKPIATSQAFWLDQSGDAYYARLNPKRPQEEKYEIWVPYYEKCFASFINHQTSDQWDPNNPSPVYNNLNYGSTAWALTNITATPYNLTNTLNYFDPAGGADNIAGMIEVMRSNINPNGGLPTNNGDMLVANRPAVADSYLSDNPKIPGCVPAIANQAKYNNGNPVAYNCPGLAANHSFSILGLYKENNTMYVILRNPWASYANSADFSPELQGCLAKGVNKLQAFAGTAKIPDTGAEGIFGLDSLTFMRYFQTFYWVT